MRKTLYISVISLLFIFSINANSQRIWSNPLSMYAYNPSAGAMNDLGELVACYYNSYASAHNSPHGILLMGSSSFPSDRLGAGFKFTSEPGGVLENMSAEATFVYKAPISRNAKLAFGLSAVYHQMGINSDLANPQHPEDPILLMSGESGSWVDANFGMSVYEANKYYLGVAMYDLIGQQTGWMLPDSIFSNRAKRLMSTTGSFTINMFRGDAKLETNAIGMFYMPQDKFSMSYDVSSRLIFGKSFWIGSGYANGMVKLIAGLYIQNLSIGYTGALATGEISDYTYSMPKHELFLRMELNTSSASRKPSR